MGVTGRNTLFAAFIASSVLFMTGKALDFPVALFFAASVATGAGVLYYYAYYCLAKKRSKKIGLTNVILLPVNPYWAKLVLWLAGRKLSKTNLRAFEVHLEIPAGTGLADYLKAMRRDLSLAQTTLPDSLFFWETSAPIPSDIRKLLRQREAEGTAFWEEKRWPLPRFAFMERELKRGQVRRGAILLQRRNVNG